MRTRCQHRTWGGRRIRGNPTCSWALLENCEAAAAVSFKKDCATTTCSAPEPENFRLPVSKVVYAKNAFAGAAKRSSQAYGRPTGWVLLEKSWQPSWSRRLTWSEAWWAWLALNHCTEMTSVATSTAQEAAGWWRENSRSNGSQKATRNGDWPANGICEEYSGDLLVSARSRWAKWV